MEHQLGQCQRWSPRRGDDWGVQRRGEFFGEESLNGRAILVRFVFSDITSEKFRFEQAFSDDWGKTWEVNWKATFTR